MSTCNYEYEKPIGYQTYILITTMIGVPTYRARIVKEAPSRHRDVG